VLGQSGSTKFVSFGTPSINDDAELTFFANITGTNGTGINPAILSGSAPLVIVKKGNVAPGTSGSFKTFRDPLLNNEGEVAFLGQISGPGVSGSNDYGLWTTLSGSLGLVVREGDTLAAPAGAVLKSFSQVALSGSVVAFVGDMVGTNAIPGPGGVTTTTNTALWMSTGGGIVLCLREGDNLPLSTGTLTVTAIKALQNASVSRADGDGLVGNQVVVRVSGSGAKSALLAVQGGSVSEITTKGSAAPGYSGTAAKFTSFTIPGQNGAGEVVFRGVASGPGSVTAANNTALYAEVSGSLTKLVTKGAAAPGTSGTYLSFLDPASNSAGELAYVTTIKGVAPGVTGSNNTAVYVDGALVAREGHPAPDTAGGIFESFTSLALPDGPLGALFQANLVSGIGGVTTANDIGIWGQNSLGVLTLLLREGQSLDGKTVKNFLCLNRVAYSHTQRRTFNSSGHLIARVTFTDGTQAIVKITVP